MSKRASAQGTCAALPKVAGGSQGLSVVRSPDGPDRGPDETSAQSRPPDGRPEPLHPIAALPSHPGVSGFTSPIFPEAKPSLLRVGLCR